MFTYFTMVMRVILIGKKSIASAIDGRIDYAHLNIQHVLLAYTLLQIISKHPLEANLAGYSLERIPKYYFLNYNIVALNLAHNLMIVSLQHQNLS